MALEETINQDIKKAMLARESQKLESLRAIKSAILLLKTSPEGYTDETEIRSLQKMVKQRKETAAIYIAQNRTDLAETELFQANIIENYLPKQMDVGTLKLEVEKIIASIGASSPADMGKVMGIASKQLSSKADGKTISAIVKELLNK